ncbi:MAG: hypothetical protein JWQ28_694 [Pedobacter sp.]|jgi:hypothetical protein|nr:hypothetical protein [Pedobacter sp.]
MKDRYNLLFGGFDNLKHRLISWRIHEGCQ